jgi:diguanylate cyclase (GGDEF)-like protein
MNALSAAHLVIEDNEVTSLLLDRALMSDRVAHAMQRTLRNQQKLLLCCIEIDQHLTLHEVYGADGIAEMLEQLGARLQKILRAVDSLGQLNHRSLTLLLEGIDQWQDVEQTMQKIMLCFAEAVIIDEQPQRITASIGITEFDGSARIETTELFEQAEFACYRARRHEGNSYAFFSGHLRARNSVQKLLAQSITSGFERNEFHVHLQPVIQLEQPACYAIESLMRWQHPTAGNILPGMFLQLLEENMLTKKVGDWMMQKSCNEWQKLIRAGKLSDDVKLSLNIHQDQFTHAEFIHSIQSLLTTFTIAPGQLILEFKGKTLLQSKINAIDLLEQLQQLGILVCIDNFGDHDSPLLCLQDLPLNIIKLAHGLVTDIETRPRHLLLIEHTYQLCRQLNIDMIVQAVDSSEKAAKLMQVGCTLLQGNYFGAAASAQDLRIIV